MIVARLSFQNWRFSSLWTYEFIKEIPTSASEHIKLSVNSELHCVFNLRFTEHPSVFGSKIVQVNYPLCVKKYVTYVFMIAKVSAQSCCFFILMAVWLYKLWIYI